MKIAHFLVALTLISLSLPAMAYIDPASGSAIMSAIIGFFVAVGIAIKTYWYKIKSIFRGQSSSSVDVDVESPQQDDRDT